MCTSLRKLFSGLRIGTTTCYSSRLLVQNVVKPTLILPNSTRLFSSLITTQVPRNLPSSQLLLNSSTTKINNVSKRTVTKYSFRTGKRKSVKTVLKRFYRLDWGGWIRTKCGRHKRLWRKTAARKRRLRQHVFCNATQSTLLDKMVTKFWRRPKYYVEDPYEPYHTREEWKMTYKTPRPYFPPESQ